jgi:hypothetical protein
MGWMTNELMGVWLQVVWNKKPGVLLREHGMFVLMHFKLIQHRMLNT